MGTLRLLSTGRLSRFAAFLRLRLFPGAYSRRPRAASESEPAPVADDDGFVDITDKLLADLIEVRRRNPNPPTSIEEFLDRHKPIPPHIGKNFLKNRPGILDIRGGVVRFKDGRKIDTDRLLNLPDEEADSGR